MELKELSQLWKPGSVQEVIPEPGETQEDAIRFVAGTLKERRPDLFFYTHEVYEKDGKYYFTFWPAPEGTVGGVVDIDF